MNRNKLSKQTRPIGVNEEIDVGMKKEKLVEKTVFIRVKKRSKNKCQQEDCLELSKLDTTWTLCPESSEYGTGSKFWIKII